MSGILTKIEALDDGDDESGEAVDVAVARVFGDAAENRDVRPSAQTAAAIPERDLGTPMPPIQDRPKQPAPRPRPNIRKPQPPKPQARSQPRPQPTAAPQARAPALTPAAKSPTKTEQSPQSSKMPSAPVDDAGKRLPPRLRKKMAQEAAETKTAEAPKARAAQSTKPQTPAKPQSQTPPPAAKAATPPAPARGGDGKRRVGMPDELRRKHDPEADKAPPPEAPQRPRKAPPAPSQTVTAPQAQPEPEVTAPTEMRRPPTPLPQAPASLGPTPKNPFAGPLPAAGGGDGTPPPPPPPEPGAEAGGDEPEPIDLAAPPPKSEVRGALAALKEETDLSCCLLPLLRALNWRGDPRHVAEALPHFTDSLDVTSFRNVLATLHYQSRPLKIRMAGIDDRLFPCLFLPEDGDALVLLAYEPAGVRVFDGGLGEERVVPRGNIRGTAYFFSPVDAEDIQTAQSKVGWFRSVSERFRSLVYQTLGITFVLNVLALVTPLFVMAVYDKVVATKSLPTLGFFAFGVAVAIGCDLILRVIRSKIMAFIGARLDNIVGIAIFHKILFLPPAFTERATIGAQVARIKDFETIRDFFTGPMAMVLFELPFVFIFIATIAFLAGPVVFVSVIMMACFFILGLIITPLLRNSVSRAGRASSRKQELLVETLSGMRAVKYCGAEEKWMERFREYSASSALNSFYTAQLSGLMQTISHVLMISAGLGTIIFGVFRVMNGDMTVGGLVASMILVWRVLAPLQTGFVSLTRLTQVKSSISQINNLMNIRGERAQHTIVNPIKQIEGYVTFARVSIRYSPDSDPALVGVSLEMEPGEVLCVVGGNGSGKSTVLKLLAGMYAPQAGSIRVDNMDIRQMDTVELRHAVAYVPQTVQFFYGTIAQNLRLAHPTATEEEMRWACQKAAVLDDILNLEQGSGKWRREGFEVRIGDSSSGQMPTSLLQRLNLARGYLKNSPIMLFDEPGNGLDFAGDQAFMRAVDAMRGKTTVLMVTHRPSHLKLADKIMWLEYGNVRAFGPADEVLKQMPKDFL